MYLIFNGFGIRGLACFGKGGLVCSPMAEPLKNFFGPEMVECWADWIEGQVAGFRRRDFVRDTLRGFGEMELMPRIRHLGEHIARHLPENFPKAARVLGTILESAPGPTPENPISSFVYLPAGVVAAARGLGHFEASMDVLKALTKRSTSEFAIRPFLREHPEATFARLRAWSGDPDEHVRRLTSEGTRPRLPWAERVPVLLRDPGPGLELLEALRDDPSEYVRRSVANHLNDVGKDHPAKLLAIAKRWGRGAGTERQRLLRHALRSLVKAGDAGALGLLGFDQNAITMVSGTRVSPLRVRLGGKAHFEAVVSAPAATRVLLDYRIHFRKANGKTSPKVFKGTTLELTAGEQHSWRATFAAIPRSTRALHPGIHRVDLLVNGIAHPLGEFRLLSD